MAQKVVTASKMKSLQETTTLHPRPNCDSDSKADNKRQAFINTDTRRFKIQTGDVGPPPPFTLAGPLISNVLLLVHETNLCYNLFVHFQGSETVSLQGR